MSVGYLFTLFEKRLKLSPYISQGSPTSALTN